MAAKARQIEYRSPATPPPGDPLRSWDLTTAFGWALCAYLLLLPAAIIVLSWGFSLPRGQEVTQDRIWFMAVNALTLTGFQGSVDTAIMPWPCSATLLVLTLAGIFTVMLLSALAAARILDLPFSDSQIAGATVTATIAVPIISSLALLPSGASAEQAWMLTTSAFGNSGLHLGPLPSQTSWKTQFILLPLAFIGSLGMPVLLEIPGAILGRRALSENARVILRACLWTFLIALAACALIRVIPESSQGLGARFASSSTLVINARSAGFNWEYAQSWPRILQWLVLLMMLVGAGPAGVAGGLHLTTLIALAGGIRKSLRSENPGRPFGLAAGWTCIYLGIIALCFALLLCTTADLRADQLLFETVSAVGNVGLSFDRVILVAPGLHVYSLAMLAGRLAPLMMLWWLAGKHERMTVMTI